MCKVSDLNGVGEAGKHTGPGSHPVVSKCEAIRQEEAPPLDPPKMIKVGFRQIRSFDPRLKAPTTPSCGIYLKYCRKTEIRKDRKTERQIDGLTT